MQACFSAVLDAVCGSGPPKLRFMMRFAVLGISIGMRISCAVSAVCGFTENVLCVGYGLSLSPG